MIPAIAIERLRALLAYDSETGVITRLRRPVEDFPSPRVWRMWNTRFAGKPTEQRRPDGYVMITIVDAGVKHFILAHRLGWALHHGRWPEHELDHGDGDGFNNRMGNLREATRPEQLQNMKPRLTQGAGRGVSTPGARSRVTMRA
jgi:hypothetical protein